jgi:hypothetical protein
MMSLVNGLFTKLPIDTEVIVCYNTSIGHFHGDDYEKQIH